MIEEIRPSHVEIDQARIESVTSSILSKLLKNERSVAKTWEKLGKGMDISLGLIKEYKQNVFESSRNYIQMIAQNSKVIDQKDLNLTREHLRRLEANIESQQQMIDAIMGIGKAYNDYVQFLSRTESVVAQISGHGAVWHETNNKLTKAITDNRANKIGKFEKKMEESREGLTKAYDNKKKEHEQLALNYNQLNKAWQVLKTSIKGIQW